MDSTLKQKLETLALRIRIGTVEALQARGFGHIGGSLSIVDALAVLYGDVMNYRADDPHWEDRDKLVCSKGHAGPGVYAALAVQGFFPYEELKTLNQPGTDLPSHCDRNKTPGIDMTTGSLGQGTSLAAGIALGDKLKRRPNRVFLIAGDGEINEGQTWEAAMFSVAKGLDNLVWLIDKNEKQLDGYTREILNIGELEEKYTAFGFETLSVDGNDVEQLHAALTRRTEGRPTAIVMHTVKGKGIKEVEETFGNHSMAPKPEKFDQWLGELRKELEALEGRG